MIFWSEHIKPGIYEEKVLADGQFEPIEAIGDQPSRIHKSDPVASNVLSG